MPAPPPQLYPLRHLVVGILLGVAVLACPAAAREKNDWPCNDGLIVPNRNFIVFDLLTCPFAKAGQGVGTAVAVAPAFLATVIEMPPKYDFMPAFENRTEAGGVVGAHLGAVATLPFYVPEWVVRDVLGPIWTGRGWRTPHRR